MTCRNALRRTKIAKSSIAGPDIAGSSEKPPVAIYGRIWGLAALAVAAVLTGVAACGPTIMAANQVPQPPAKYQGNHRLVAFTFVDPDAVPTACGQTQGEILTGKVVEACTIKTAVFTEVVLPNPFKWPATDLVTWALIAMHELGHANGWPANHPTS